MYLNIIYLKRKSVEDEAVKYKVHYNIEGIYVNYMRMTL